MLLYKGGLLRAISSNRIPKCDNFQFSRHTTYGLGGKAAVAYLPKNVYQAKLAYDLLKSNDIPYKVVGNGSNLLVSDKGYEGGVICTKHLKGIVRISQDKILCLAGTTVAQVLSYCKKNGLGGLEYMYGIPATMGGAAYMNAGVCGFSLGDNIVNVKVYDGKTHVLPREICNFAYRRSTMRDINALILSIIAKVEAVPQEETERRINFFKERRKHLPKGRSCGCVFKNPDNYSAGYLIEQAGLKGFTVGGATVSREHASFIINNNGSADDIRHVIEIVKRRVFDKFGILLEEEVVYIGDFNEING